MYKDPKIYTNKVTPVYVKFTDINGKVVSGGDIVLSRGYEYLPSPILESNRVLMTGNYIVNDGRANKPNIQDNIYGSRRTVRASASRSNSDSRNPDVTMNNNLINNVGGLPTVIGNVVSVYNFTSKDICVYDPNNFTYTAYSTTADNIGEYDGSIVFNLVTQLHIPEVNNLDDMIRHLKVHLPKTVPGYENPDNFNSRLKVRIIEAIEEYVITHKHIDISSATTVHISSMLVVDAGYVAKNISEYIEVGDMNYLLADVLPKTNLEKHPYCFTGTKLTPQHLEDLKGLCSYSYYINAPKAKHENKFIIIGDQILEVKCINSKSMAEGFWISSFEEGMGLRELYHATVEQAEADNIIFSTVERAKNYRIIDADIIETNKKHADAIETINRKHREEIDKLNKKFEDTSIEFKDEIYKLKDSERSTNLKYEEAKRKLDESIAEAKQIMLNKDFTIDSLKKEFSHYKDVREYERSDRLSTNNYDREVIKMIADRHKQEAEMKLSDTKVLIGGLAAAGAAFAFYKAMK